LDDVPDEIKNSMNFVFVETVEELLEAALQPPPAAPAKKATKRPAKSSGKSRKNGKSPSSRR
jgi:hypothetical protein